VSIDEWRPAAFTSNFREQDPEPPTARWENVLQAEDSVAHRVVTAIARSESVGRVLRIPGELGEPPGSSLAEREKHAEAVGQTWLARLLKRFVGDSRAPAVRSSSEGGLPPIGPRLDREIDASLAMLSSMAFQEIQQRGWHFQPNHYYWPLNDLEFLRSNPEFWKTSELPKEIDWDIEGQLDLAERIARYSVELEDVQPGPPEKPGEFAWGDAFSGLDAYAYYGLVRELAPSCVIEVGAGMSSVLLRRALARNEQDCQVTLVDPGPRWSVLGELPSEWELIPRLVQGVDFDTFSRLGAGDILFYDGSHCVRTGSDVNWLFFEVLPRLSPGVWIHFHDIFLPSDYWEKWIFDEGLSWNEQYLLQGFLMHNQSYRVRFGAWMLRHYHRPRLEDWFPSNIHEAGSLWIEKTS
jgi:hypothetical protein